MMRFIFGFLALTCFIAGLAFLPFGNLAGNNLGSNPALGWAIYLSSVLIPWILGFWFVRIAIGKPNEKTPPTE